MKMPLSKDKINNIWWGGFCAEAVRQAAGTDLVEGKESRIEWMTKHVKTCVDCSNAERLKGLEAKAAKSLSFAAEEAFRKGQDFTTLPGAGEAISAVMRDAILGRKIDASFFGWLAKMAQRNGRDFDEYED
jgi:hypothetical protein